MTIAYAFDLDGTVTTKEILPVIAAEIGAYEEMATLTELTLTGLIEFEKSFRLRCLILASIPISVVRALVESIPCDPHIANFIREHRTCSYIITGNLDCWTQGIATQLGCGFFSSTAVVEGDRLLRVAHVLRKSSAIRQLKQSYKKVVAVGESVNDIPMFEEADVRIAYGGVHMPAPDALRNCDYAVYDGGALCRLLSTL